MDTNWKERFPPWILERGSTCQQMGRVHRLTHRGHEVSAVVEGTELYHAAVHFSRGIPVSAACSCPYAAKGTWCKHIAALLFELEALDYAPEADALPSWEDALAELSPEILRVVLRNLAEENVPLQELLLRLYDLPEPQR